MNWFTNLCHNLGLMVHNIRHPDDPSNKQIVRKKTEEAQMGNMILRRTTIDEIEYTDDKHD
ncbi:MAG: hypothetical protein GC162_08435 [Planctomycetes bacterium]|nr:hypothetical protein [Planctomycetota bacterium]